MKNDFILIFMALVLITGKTNGQESGLQSGPMVGYSEMREVMLWVQTTHSMEVQFGYWDVEDTLRKFFTDKTISSRETGFTVHLKADQVMPGKRYEYALFLDGQQLGFDYKTEFQSQTLWQYRTDPPEFDFVIGSCNYVADPVYDRPGKPYGGDYQIFEQIHKQDPDMMLWLGDNTYFREADWNTKTGIYYRNTHTRSLSQLQPLLGSTHHYAIWDDHDYGPNDADASFWNKSLTRQAFEDFWANPGYGVDGQEGITGKFSWADCDFFLLDNRTYRTPKYNKGKRKVLGDDQANWLIDALKYSRASFKFVAVGGQFLNPAQAYENHSNYPEERAYLLKRIEEENLRNVIFLSGDRHHSEISKTLLSNEIVVYDITSSPLTSGAHKKLKEENETRIEGSLIKERNFTKISVMGKRKKRKLMITYFNSNGEELFTYSIERQGYK